MPRRLLFCLCCAICGFTLGCGRKTTVVNEIPAGPQLSQYNDAVTLVENQIDQEN